MKPFRWNVSRLEQLGTLVEGERAESYDGFEDELKICAARLMAFSNNAELVFVGRSPESLYDYLCGIFAETSWQHKLHYLNISNRSQQVKEIQQANPAAYHSLKNHFSLLGLDPQTIIRQKSSLCFVDLVDMGGTFRALYEFLLDWGTEEKQDMGALTSKIRFIGITARTKTSPNTWRWQQTAEWVKEYQVKAIKNVSISCDLWSYLGNSQPKVSPTHPPQRWSSESILLPPREDANLKALRRAYDLYNKGRAERRAFSALLAKEIEMRESWFRDIVTALRKKG